jgi:hypothetical protein
VRLAFDYLQTASFLKGTIIVPVSSYQKLDIAREYLDAAMQMYLDEHNYFCAIHLAGAAAELLDRHLANDNRLLPVARKAQKALHLLETGNSPSDKEVNDVINGRRNAIKHVNDGEASINLDPVREAKWWIECALTICFYLELPKSNT